MMDCRVKPGNDGRRRLTGTALQTELPDGANPFSLPRENIPLNPSGKSKVKSRPSRPTRGAYRDRHGRRVRDAVAAAMPGAQDVRRADVSVSEHRAPDESIAADGKTVWSWRPWLASSRRRSCEAQPGFASLQSGGDGGKRNSSPG